MLVFLVSSFLLAAVMDFVALASGGLGDAYLTMVWGFLRMYTPAVASALAGYKWYRKRPKLNIRVLVFYLFAPTIVYLAILLYSAIVYGLGYFTADKLLELLSAIPFRVDTVVAFYLLAVNMYIAAVTINALFAFGEEIGWRGFLQESFESLGLGFTKASLMVGVVWGLWHGSAIVLLGYNYPDNRLLGVLLFIVLTVTFSIPHALIKRLASSILPTASLHGAINAAWGLTLLITELPRELAGLGPIAMLVWAIVSITLYTAFILWKKKQLSSNIG